MDDLTAERFRPAESERPKRTSALKVLAEIEQRRRILVGKDGGSTHPQVSARRPQKPTGPSTGGSG